MATITFCGESFTVDHAVKGSDYVHGYDVRGNIIVSLDGVSDFSGITYDGEYMDPDDCLPEACNDAKYCGGKLKTRGGSDIPAAAVGAIAKCKAVTTSETDLNDYTEEGWYFFSSSYTPTNIPSGSNGWLQVARGGTLCKQLWYRMGTPGSNDYQTFVRTYNGTDWGAWERYVVESDMDRLLNLDFITDDAHMIASDDDLCSSKYTIPGSYRCSSASIAATLKNSIPRTDSGFRLIVTAQSSASGVVHIAIVNTRYTEIYVRTMTATDTWGDWVKLSHSGNNRMTLLWENASPASSFTSFNPLSLDLSNYTAIEVWYRTYKNEETYVSSIVPIGVGSGTSAADVQQVTMCHAPGNNQWARRYCFASKSAVTFGTGGHRSAVSNNWTVDSTYMIPVRIYGIR